MAAISVDARHALSRLSEAVDGHLRHEEAGVLPLIPEVFTLEDIAVFQAEAVRTNPPHAFLPWVLDDGPAADTAFVTGRLPAAVREQLDAAWLPRRRSIVEALSATGPVAVVMPSAAV